MTGISFLIFSEYAHFRIPYSNSYLATYPFPPKPTILGIIGAALGWSFSKVIENQDKFLVGVKVLNKKIKKIEDDITLLKFEDKSGLQTTLMKMELLVRPKFEIFIYSEDNNLIEKLYDIFLNKDFVYPLYLGKNEFMAQVDNVKFYENVEKQKQHIVNSILAFRDEKIRFSQSFDRPCNIYLRVPLKFKLIKFNTRKLIDTYNVLFSPDTIILDNKFDLWRFNDEWISMI